jgi:hypothetical protein
MNDQAVLVAANVEHDPIAGDESDGRSKSLEQPTPSGFQRVAGRGRHRAADQCVTSQRQAFPQGAWSHAQGVGWCGWHPVCIPSMAKPAEDNA